MKRRGFTLIEMLIAFAIMTLVATQLFVVTRETFNLWRNKMWEIDFGLKMRASRERLLFQAVPDTSNGLCGGFLSATNIVTAGRQLAAVFQCAKSGDMSLDWTPASQNVFPLIQIVGIDDGERSIDSTEITNSLFFLSVETSLKGFDGRQSNRVERIAVPSWEHVGEKSGRMPWSDFIDVQAGDIQWKQ